MYNLCNLYVRYMCKYMYNICVWMISVTYLINICDKVIKIIFLKFFGLENSESVDHITKTPPTDWGILNTRILKLITKL